MNTVNTLLKVTHQLHTKSIDWSNKAIEKLKYSGPINDRLRLIIKFNLEKGSFLKGVSIRWTPKKNKKVFQFTYKFKGKTFRYDLGEYTPTYGTHECQKDLLELIDKYKDRKGNWIYNPKERIKTKEEAEATQKLTIRRVIELICEQGFPRKKVKGFVSAEAIKEYTRYLIGYNQRRTHITFLDDENGWGKIIFKPNSSIQTWQQLFEKYPPGVGFIKGTKDNRNNEISLYDNELGAMLIEDLTPGIVEQLLESKTRSYGTKLNIKTAISCLWGFARSKLNCLGSNPKFNPTRSEYGGINIMRDEVSNWKGSKYNDVCFSIEQLEQIETALINLRDKYPFIAEALLMLLHTGIRIQECLKLRWDMLTKDEDGYEVIMVKRTITKGRGNFNQKDEPIYLTDNVTKVLRLVKDQLSKPKHQKYTFVPYIFVSTRLSPEKLINPSVYPGYASSKECRIKEVGLVNCWKDVKKITGIDGAMKTLRKSFGTLAVDTLGSASKGKIVTRHKNENTLSRHYVKGNKATARKYAYEVAKVYEFKKN
jgi:integrase